MKNNKYYITTPLYYVNSKPHLGTLYSTLLADVSARWNKLLGKRVFFLTGTDEHGQKIADRAKQEKIDPNKFVDAAIPAFKDMWERYELKYDKFIRTTDPEHEQAVLSWIKVLHDQGDIYKSTYDGWYCVPCETFVTVDGKETKPKCPSCKRELKEIEEENYFFRLSAYEDQLLEFYEKNPNLIVPKERLNEVISFVKSGLKDLSISRKGVTWGIPFPGDKEHTVYVWADALLNYISAIGYGKDDEHTKEFFGTLWPVDLQVMAKDIIRFHAIYWPAFLMAAHLPLPKKLLVHGYILSGEEKMSKSLGNAIDPGELADVYGVEPVRYYLLRKMSINQDGMFSIKDLQACIASDLANNLGNLLQRTVALALNNKLDKVKPPKVLEVASQKLHARLEEAFRSYWDGMNHYQYHMALGDLWRFISEVNAYFNEQQPWSVAKKDKDLFAEIISSVCHCLYSVAVLIWPVMPKKSEEMLKTLGFTFDFEKHDYQKEIRDNIWDKTFSLTKRDKPLFERPDGNGKKNDKIEEKEVKKNVIDEITIDDVIKVHLVVGEIKSCEPIKGSSKLYKMSVDCGSYGNRQILAGVAQFFKPEDLIGKQGVYVANLKPRKMMGLESQGMMLFAKDDSGDMKMTTVGGTVKNGTRLS
jgi:methionyl-tRNA synthetase